MVSVTHRSFNIVFVCVSWFSQWFWLPMDPGILVFLFVWFSLWFWLSRSLHTCIALVFSMVLHSCCGQSCLKLHPIYLFISQLSSHLDAFGIHWFYQWFLLSHRLSIAELHAPHELQHVLKSLPRERCSRLHESMCFKISVLVQTRTQLPIVVTLNELQMVLSTRRAHHFNV